MKKMIIMLAAVASLLFIIMISLLAVPTKPIEELKDGELYKYYKTHPKFDFERIIIIHEDGAVTYKYDGETSTYSIPVEELKTYIDQKEFIMKKSFLVRRLIVDEFACKSCLFTGHLVNRNGRTYFVEEDDFLREHITTIEKKRQQS